MTTFKQYLLIALVALSFVFTPIAANAQSASLSCNTGNGNVGGGQFYDSSTAATGFCQYQGIQHIFSQILCNFVIILDNVLGQTYCGIQYSLKSVLAAALSLYMVIFGAQILMGTAHLNAHDIVIRLLKIGGVWMFATNAAWGVGLIFQFFAGAASQGSLWVISILAPQIPTCTDIATTTGNNVTAGTAMSIYQYLDCLIYNAILGPFTNSNDKVTGFFIVLMFFFPAIFLLAVNWTLTTVMMLARTLVDFLLCLSTIAFLVALSPIFLSFMLFEATRNYFEDWLKYLITYTLQIIIVFAIIALWIAAMSLFGGFFNELSNLIFPYQQVDVTNVYNPDNTYGICQYITSYSIPGNPTVGCTAGLPCLPSLQCDGSGIVFPPSQLEFHEDFVYFMVYNLTILTIIAYMFSVLIKNAPDVARQISGPAQASPLGAGFGAGGFGMGGGSGSGSGSGSGAGVQAPPAGKGNAVNDFLARAGQMLAGRGEAAGAGADAGMAGGGVGAAGMGAGAGAGGAGVGIGGAGAGARGAGAAPLAWSFPQNMPASTDLVATRGGGGGGGVGGDGGIDLFGIGAGMGFGVSAGGTTPTAGTAPRLDPTAKTAWTPVNVFNAPALDPSKPPAWNTPGFDPGAPSAWTLTTLNPGAPPVWTLVNVHDTPTLDPSKPPAWTTPGFNPGAPSAWTLVTLDPNQPPAWTLTNVLNAPALDVSKPPAWTTPGFNPDAPAAWTLVALNPGAPPAWTLTNVLNVPALDPSKPPAWNTPGFNPDAPAAWTLVALNPGAPPAWTLVNIDPTAKTAWTPTNVYAQADAGFQQAGAGNLFGGTASDNTKTIAYEWAPEKPPANAPVTPLLVQQNLDRLKGLLGNNVPQRLVGLLATNPKGMSPDELAEIERIIELELQTGSEKKT